jgi:hypothetical protein
MTRSNATVTVEEVIRFLDEIYDAAQTDSMAAVYANIRAARRALIQKAKSDDIKRVAAVPVEDFCDRLQEEYDQ